jgi:beta-N-acetylglucosaminidase
MYPSESVIALLQSGISNPKQYIAIEEPKTISRGNLDKRYDSDIAPKYNLKIHGASKLSLEDYKIILKNSFLYDYAPIIQQVENEYEINGLFIIAVARLESGNGTSKLAINKNNYFGLGAYGNNPYRNAIKFKDDGECIEYFGKLIKENYIDQGLDTLPEINNKYCASEDWKDKVKEIMQENIEKLTQIN